MPVAEREDGQTRFGLLLASRTLRRIWMVVWTVVLVVDLEGNAEPCRALFFGVGRATA
jgi:hypothetical protein